MEEYTSITTSPEIDIFIRIAGIFDKHFKENLYSPTIIGDMIQTLPPHERTKEAEDAARHVVFNRQLMRERFL